MATVESLFRTFLAEHQVLIGAAALPYGKDWSNEFGAQPSVVLFPENYEQVQQIVVLASEQKFSIIPSGGRTGLSGGASALGGEVVLSLDRLNRILDFDPSECTVCCQAGVVTERLKDYVAQRDLYFPFHFASQGSSQIGGNIATNAGGIHVIRYGLYRDWVLGLKVVLPTGELVDLNRGLVKNQSGYDLRGMFIGSEGTLGVVVEATLKLTVPPGDRIRVLAVPPSIDKILELLPKIKAQIQSLSAFEFFDQCCLDKVVAHQAMKKPFGDSYPWYLLLEFEQGNHDLQNKVEHYVSALLENGELLDAVVSQSTTQADALLAYRERISETLSKHYLAHKNDLSVRVREVPRFVAALQKLLAEYNPKFQAGIFGHIGDGNIHCNILKPADLAPNEFFAQCKHLDREVFALVNKFGGSISAEHGIGLLKKPFLSYARSEKEIEMMRAIKKVCDPQGILNPGKIFD